MGRLLDSRIGAAAFLIGLVRPGVASALPGPPPGAGPEYAQYQSPIHLHGDILIGGLVCVTAVLVGGLLIGSRRPLAGGLFGAIGLALGVFLAVCQLDIR